MSMKSTSRYFQMPLGSSSQTSSGSSPLRHKICWRWCVRYTILVTAWASITVCLWIFSQPSCDSERTQTRADVTNGKAYSFEPKNLRSPKNNPDFLSHNDNLDSQSQNVNQHFQLELINQLSSKTTLLHSSEINTVDFNLELIRKLQKKAERNTLISVYQKNWVGFREIAGSNCQKALHSKGNNSEFPQTVKRTRSSQYILDSQDCEAFLHKYGFNRYPKTTEEEKEFPIAFIILFYKDLDQVLFLLRAIYQLHNVYCLSVDTKASIELLEAVRSVTKCLPNVFVASKLENIVYAGFSRLMADIDCMKDLLQHPVQWKYVINMPGTQFPLRTNLEMVKILKIFNGGNDIEGLTGDMLVADRYEFKHTYVTDQETGEMRVKNMFVANDPPPHGLEMVKGSTYGTFSRAFVEFSLGDPVAKEFLEWCKSVKSPDEYFWGTLHHSKILDVPGGFKGKPHGKPWLTSFSLWETNPTLKCATIYVHKICIFSPEDFPIFINRAQLFANKFYITHHPAALHCLDEMLVNLTYSGVTRDLRFYKRVPFAIKKNPSA
ncbi:unnamed protein product [Candidula unifasciata]|uniref:Glycosyltransferase n=1 Tax=Candidula unifasciata TaxID=100452 RepID=A0A8S4A502_9EUPU|nr:unnamed protein product [Candidula unifasciata]